jgi:hypothetical protein
MALWQNLRRITIRSRLSVVKPTIEKQIDDFVAKYLPEMAQELRKARSQLRSLFPRGFELVFDNYNALVFAFAPVDSSSAAFLSVAAYPRWITLFFAQGATLSDPDGLLTGAGKRIRGLRLKSAKDLNLPEVQALIEQAMAREESALTSSPPLTTLIKTQVANQRSRRPN